MTYKYNPFATSYPSSRGPLGKVFRPVIDFRTYLPAGHMLLMFPLGIAYFVFFVVTLSVGGALIWTLIGPVILLAVLFISRWLGDLEAITAAYVNGAPIRRPPSGLEGVSNFRSQVKVRLVDPTTWTGVVYLFAQFPIGVAAFVGLVTMGSVIFALLFSPIIALYSDVPIHIIGDIGWSYTINSPLDGLLLTPIGVLGLVLASHMILAFSSIHGWWARLMLGSRSSRVSSRPAPTPAGGDPPKPSTTASPEVAATDPAAEISADPEPETKTTTEPPSPAAPSRFNPVMPATASAAPATLTPVPNPSEVRPEDAPNTAAIRELTAREQEVFMLMAHGDTNADIAEELFISEGTVKTHVKRVLSKLYMRDRTQVVVFAYEQGLVIPQSGAEQSRQRRSYGG
ncbi:MAG: sensor domain-containing protein [Chloroflexi bacterium]|nr:sensor domain-containing protein [Chloroflexota bacterium]